MCLGGEGGECYHVGYVGMADIWPVPVARQVPVSFSHSTPCEVSGCPFDPGPPAYAPVQIRHTGLYAEPVYAIQFDAH